MTIDQLSCIGPNLIPNQPPSLNIPYMQAVYPPPQINYVATCSMPTSIDDLVGNVMHHLLWSLVSDLSIGSFDTFHSVVLPYYENLLESMVFYKS